MSVDSFFPFHCVDSRKRKFIPHHDLLTVRFRLCSCIYRFSDPRAEALSKHLFPEGDFCCLSFWINFFLSPLTSGMATQWIFGWAVASLDLLNRREWKAESSALFMSSFSLLENVSRHFTFKILLNDSARLFMFSKETVLSRQFRTEQFRTFSYYRGLSSTVKDFRVQ